MADRAREGRHDPDAGVCVNARASYAAMRQVSAINHSKRYGEAGRVVVTPDMVGC